MNKVIFLFLLLFTTLYAKNFNLILQKPFNDALFNISENLDNSITAVGFITKFQKKSKKFYTNPYNYLKAIQSHNGVNIYLVQVDNYAKIIQKKSFPLPYVARAKSIVKTPSNGYIIATQNLDGTLSLFKLTSSLLLQKKIKFGTKNKNQLSNMIALEDGGVLVVGNSMTSREKEKDIFESGLGGEDIYLAKFSHDLHKIWSKKIGTNNDEVGIDALELPNGSFIVLANYIKKRVTHSELFKITQNGDVQWKQTIKSNKPLISHKLLLLHNGEILLLLNTLKNTKKVVTLSRYTKEGILLFSKNLPLKNSVTLYDIKEFSNSNLVAVGKREKNGDNDGFIVGLDKDFNIYTQHHYGKKNYDTFYALKILRNSQVAVVGLHRTTQSQQSNLWLLKFNPNLTLKTIPFKIEQVTKKPDFNNFEETPCSDPIQITHTSKKSLQTKTFSTTLYFQQGKYRLTQQHKKKLALFSKKLMQFLLKNKQRVKYLEVMGYTSSEWNTKDFQSRFLKNMSLSTQRTYSVLSYFFKQQTKENQHYLAKILKGESLSFIETQKQGSQEDKKHSRRVTFKVVFK